MERAGWNCATKNLPVLPPEGVAAAQTSAVARAPRANLNLTLSPSHPLRRSFHLPREVMKICILDPSYRISGSWPIQTPRTKCQFCGVMDHASMACTNHALSSRFGEGFVSTVLPKNRRRDVPDAVSRTGQAGFALHEPATLSKL
jgi:hypothetical protein